ncbi:hypothetical protein KKF23_04790, partial [Patescibacteria group bacterium]|nr:hypothetical protein [Patescibacteria group bacterium]
LWSQDANTQEGSTASLRSDYGADGEVAAGDDGAVAASESEKEVWVGRFYAGEPFYKDAAENKWYQTETATTTAEEFSKQTKPNFLAKLKAFFNMNVLADTGSYYAGAGDGRVGFINQPYWDTVHNSTIGGSISYTIATAVVKSEDIGDSVAHAYGIFRMFIPIDTSGIDDSAIISTAKLYLYCTAKSSGDNDGDDWINVVQTSQVSNSSLVTEDYDQCGAIHSAEEGCDTRIDISSASTATWWNWALNTTGKSWVNKTGWTKLGLREGHDILDSPIAVDYAFNSVTFSMSEQTGTSQDPYLEVIWVVPPTIVTNPASLVASTVATGNGNITDIGTATVTERGFKYGLTETDTWSVSETGGFSAGVFKLEIPNLTPGATYHIRAFATSADGTGYGSYVSFITLTEQTGSPIIFKRNTILKENVILK